MEEKKSESFPVNLKILSMKLVNFSIENLNEDTKKSLDKDRIVFEYGIDLSVDQIGKKVTSTNHINIFNDFEKSILLGNISVAGEFSVINLDEIIKNFNNKIPLTFLSLFPNIVLSTARGILLAKTEGTFLEGVLIPIVDSSKLIAGQNP